MENTLGLSRRALLTGGLGLGLGLAGGVTRTLAASPNLMGVGRGPRPGAIGHKFNTEGGVLPFAGSTVICHLDPASAIHRVLIQVQAEAAQAAFMRKFTLLPASSLHMTVLPGVDNEHRKPPLWPDTVSPSAPIETCNAWCADQLRAVRTGVWGLHMRPKPIVDINTVADFTVPLEARSAAEDHRLRHLRDRLSGALRIRAPGHDAYRFHITLGYQIAWLTAEEADAFSKAYAGWMTRIAAAAPRVTLGRPEFCTFETMFAFDRQFYLSA